MPINNLNSGFSGMAAPRDDNSDDRAREKKADVRNAARMQQALAKQAAQDAAAPMAKPGQELPKMQSAADLFRGRFFGAQPKPEAPLPTGEPKPSPFSMFRDAVLQQQPPIQFETPEMPVESQGDEPSVMAQPQDDGAAAQETGADKSAAAPRLPAGTEPDVQEAAADAPEQLAAQQPAARDAQPQTKPTSGQQGEMPPPTEGDTPEQPAGQVASPRTAQAQANTLAALPRERQPDTGKSESQSSAGQAAPQDADAQEARPQQTPAPKDARAAEVPPRTDVPQKTGAGQQDGQPVGRQPSQPTQTPQADPSQVAHQASRQAEAAPLPFKTIPKEQPDAKSRTERSPQQPADVRAQPMPTTPATPQPAAQPAVAQAAAQQGAPSQAAKDTGSSGRIGGTGGGASSSTRGDTAAIGRSEGGRGATRLDTSSGETRAVTGAGEKGPGGGGLSSGLSDDAPKENEQSEEAAAAAQQNALSGASILERMMGAKAAAPAEEAQPAAGALNADRMEQMVDKLFVKVPERAGDAAMARMELSGDVLPGTAVQITRAADGSVQVQFISDNYNSLQALNQHGKSLETMLADKLGAAVEVRVTDRGREQNEGRSRNRQQYENTEDEDE